MKLTQEKLIGYTLLAVGILVEILPFIALALLSTTVSFGAFAVSAPSIGLSFILSSAQWGVIFIVLGIVLVLFATHHARKWSLRTGIMAIPEVRFSKPAGLFGVAMITVALLVPWLLVTIYGILGTVFVLFTGWLWFLLFLAGIIALIVAFFMKGKAGGRTG